MLLADTQNGPHDGPFYRKWGDPVVVDAIHNTLHPQYPLTVAFGAAITQLRPCAFLPPRFVIRHTIISTCGTIYRKEKVVVSLHAYMLDLETLKALLYIQNYHSPTHSRQPLHSCDHVHFFLQGSEFEAQYSRHSAINQRGGDIIDCTDKTNSAVCIKMHYLRGW